MSDTVTDVEIEDVLSSIRRLVGDEHRIKSRLKPVDIRKKPTKLVLTPSLLVPVSDAPKAEPGDEAKSGSILSTVDSASVNDSLDSQKPEHSEAVVEILNPNPGPEATPANEQDMDSESELDFDFDTVSESSEALRENFADTETDEPTVGRADTDELFDGPSAQESPQAPWHNLDATLFRAADLLEDDDPTGVDHDEQQNEDESVAQETHSFDIADAPDADHIDVPDQESTDLPDISQVETSESQELPSEPEPAVLTEISADHDPVGTACLSEDDLDEQPEGTDTVSDDPEDNVPYSTATLSSKIAALEAKIGQTKDQWEPDGELGDDYAGTHVETIEWRDHKADEIPEPRRPALNPAALDPGFVSNAPDDNDCGIQEYDAQDGDADRLDPLEEDDAILDEESLRELVADIVRQELQGALGERITRNVRKLVRREIHRALTAQELD